ncbi:MAG: 16S rRNA (guanine(966)-N(2))-methyltransferase RsmD [Chromatiaceae bacterium]|nr:MAG: 16S rRNA (guanine(966)-N(2))-methyltransferase RsmD [Chromatiaceae bacterium]
MARAEGGQLRIIGGCWRGRRLPVPAGAHPGLRPTPDRVRETLFNWVAPTIAGSRVLDAFAGTGALGFEAASRGAAEVLLIEQVPALAAGLRAAAAQLQATALQVICADSLHWLARGPAQPFDLVMLDPPFGQGLLAPALAALSAGWLTAGGVVYLELGVQERLPPLPVGWRLQRDKRAGQVRYVLVANDACTGRGQAR